MCELRLCLPRMIRSPCKLPDSCRWIHPKFFLLTAVINPSNRWSTSIYIVYSDSLRYLHTRWERGCTRWVITKPSHSLVYSSLLTPEVYQKCLLYILWFTIHYVLTYFLVIILPMSFPISQSIPILMDIFEFKTHLYWY